MSNGKGSAQRPIQISKKEFSERWDSTFPHAHAVSYADDARHCIDCGAVLGVGDAFTINGNITPLCERCYSKRGGE